MSFVHSIEVAKAGFSVWKNWRAITQKGVIIDSPELVKQAQAIGGPITVLIGLLGYSVDYKWIEILCLVWVITYGLVWNTAATLATTDKVGISDILPSSLVQSPTVSSDSGRDRTSSVSNVQSDPSTMSPSIGTRSELQVVKAQDSLDPMEAAGHFGKND